MLKQLLHIKGELDSEDKAKFLLLEVVIAPSKTIINEIELLINSNINGNNDSFWLYINDQYKQLNIN